jgi:hypothetical protein
LDYLEGLRAEGEFHSSGCFTLDFGASKSRYASLAKADRSGFLRLALMSAQSGPPCNAPLRLSAGFSQASLEWESDWGEPDLLHLFGYLEGRQDEHRRADLQYAKLSLIMASCRTDLVVRLQVKGVSQTLYLDSQGPRWEKVASPCSQTRWLFSLRGGTDLEAAFDDIFSARLAMKWPEILELKEHFAHFSQPLLLNGKAYSGGSLFHFDPSAPEIVRVGFLHPEAERNLVPMNLTQLPKPLSWVSPVTLLLVDAAGQVSALSTSSKPLYVNCLCQIHLGDCENEEGQRFRLLKGGFPLIIRQQHIPKQAKVAIEAGQLATDLTSRKPLEDEHLQAKIEEGRARLREAAQLAQKWVKEAPRWQSFLQGSRQEALQRLIR